MKSEIKIYNTNIRIAGIIIITISALTVGVGIVGALVEHSITPFIALCSCGGILGILGIWICLSANKHITLITADKIESHQPDGVKSFATSELQRIVLYNLVANRGSVMFLILDEGSFNEYTTFPSLLGLIFKSKIKQNGNWIALQYSKRKHKKLKSLFPNVPVTTFKIDNDGYILD